MLFSDYLDLEPRTDTQQSVRRRVSSDRFSARKPRWNFATFPVVGGVGKDCPAANGVLEPLREREQKSVPGNGPSTHSALADCSLAASRTPYRSLSWADLGGVLGNFLGGALFIGGMFLLPFALRQVLSLL